MTDLCILSAIISRMKSCICTSTLKMYHVHMKMKSEWNSLQHITVYTVLSSVHKINCRSKAIYFKKSYFKFHFVLSCFKLYIPLLSASPPLITRATVMSPVISWRLMVAPWQTEKNTVWSLKNLQVSFQITSLISFAMTKRHWKMHLLNTTHRSSKNISVAVLLHCIKSFNILCSHHAKITLMTYSETSLSQTLYLSFPKAD